MNIIKTTASIVIGVMTAVGVANAQTGPDPANGGNPASYVAAASAEILEPIVIAENTAMNFGVIVPSDITTSSAEFYTTRRLPLNGTVIDASSISNGSFSIQGTDGRTVTVVSQAVPDGCGIDGLTLGVANAGGATSAVLDEANFVVEGTLSIEVGTTAAVGVVTCPYTVTANY